MKIKEILIVSLEQRIIILPLHLYLNSLLSRVLDRMGEWNLLNKKITGKEKYFKYFVEKEILDLILEIKIVYKELNLKILTILKKVIIQKNLEYFEENNSIIDTITSISKKLFKKYFKKIDSENLNFLPSDKKFKGLNCGQFTGEEIEFLTKLK